MKRMFSFFNGEDKELLNPLLADETSLGRMPSFTMLKIQRVYAITDEMVPSVLSKETLREMARLMFNENVAVLIERKTGETYITSKKIDQIENCKSVTLDKIFTSLHTPPVIKAFCSFLINEYLPNVRIDAVDKLCTRFLADFDEVLSLRVRSMLSTNANFRTLGHRICTKKLSEEDLEFVLDSDSLQSKYRELIEIFQ